MSHARSLIAEYFLTRRGTMFVEPSSAAQPDRVMHAFEVELDMLGYVPSSRLVERLRTLPDEALAEVVAWMTRTLHAHKTTGAHGETASAISFEPLFRSFPNDIPSDTEALWWDRLLACCFGAVRQPCPTCGATGTSHILEPCHHVVCDQCFDGANYSACPVCLRHVSRDSPFFQPTKEERAAIPAEHFVRVRVDLADSLDIDAAARSLFESFCARQQPLSPDDRAGIEAIVNGYGETTLAWLPEKVPLRENIAAIFGNLLRTCTQDRVLPIAERYLTTATDVLRLLAVFSGEDASLVGTESYCSVGADEDLTRWRGATRMALEKHRRRHPDRAGYTSMRERRWKMAKLPRAMRRTVLALLERLPFESLADDMLRHRSPWVWAGEFLHPHEYATRFPNVARAFAIVRGKDPGGEPAPAYQTWTGRVEGALQRGELDTALTLLERRPGELGRRFDRLLRVASARAANDPNAVVPVVQAFERIAPKLATPLLVAMAGHLPARLRPLPARVYFPKGTVALGESSTDRRPSLHGDVVAPTLRAVTAQILGRFATRAAYEDAVIDEQLREVIAPFGERTASPAAVALPRGSRVSLPPSPTVRMFLHWCEPAKGGRRTDVDLSVAFFDSDWCYRGVCSYYQLTYTEKGHAVAKSSGDFTSAPFPDGASEYVDLDRAAARAAGLRYAVMVVNAYAGMPFSMLERAFAGFMLRDDTSGAYFDPRKVTLRFGLSGDNGVFMPVVLDLSDDVMHWVDVYSKGEIASNNVAGAKSLLGRIGAATTAYFGSGARASMFDLARWHAAARARHVFIRGRVATGRFDRHDGETPEAFARRIDRGEHDATNVTFTADRPVLAALHTGDLELPAGSESYVLFPERGHGTVAASDWIR